MTDEPLGEVQPLLLQQGLAAEPAVPLQDGLAETVGPLVAHLHGKQGGGGGQNRGLRGPPSHLPASQFLRPPRPGATFLFLLYSLQGVKCKLTRSNIHQALLCQGLF